MKKISILLLMSLLVFSLAGCQLAQENTDTQNTDSTNELLPYLPVEFTFEVYDAENGFIDVSEYYYYCWYEGSDFHDDYLHLTSRIGKSMEVIKSYSGTFIIEVDGETTETEHVEEFEANYFIGRSSNFDGLYPNATFMSYDGETYVENLTGLGVGGGISMTYTFEVENFNDENWKIIFGLNIIVLDDLQTVEVREFDESDNLIKTTMITEETILDELTLDSNTDYYFIMETYKDMDDKLYTERYFFNSDDTTFHKYKFLNEAGFVYLDCLYVQESE